MGSFLITKKKSRLVKCGQLVYTYIYIFIYMYMNLWVYEPFINFFDSKEIQLEPFCGI